MIGPKPRRRRGIVVRSGGVMLRSKLSVCSMPVALLAVGAAFAQGQQQDFSAVQIKTHQVAGNLYYLEGQGGNVGVLVGDDGVLMIDDQFAPLSEKLLAAIRALSDKPIRMLLNTHVHGDHTGGNENFGKLGIDIVAHDNVRVRLARGVNNGPPSPAAALPVITFGDSMSVHLNGETVTAAKLPPSHTDGDAYVHFAKADVIHTGDVFRTVGYPGVDFNNGGSVKGTIEALQKLVDMAGPNTKILPGHGVVVTRAEVAAFRDLAVELQKRFTDLINRGMTLEQVVAAKPTADLDAKYGSSERLIPAFYNAVKAEIGQ
jgi:glyoxylase-like metal-dependent hydrolase (beta-lactamase superfamily II)